MRGAADLLLTRGGGRGSFGIPIEDKLSMPTGTAVTTAARASGAEAGTRGGLGMITTIITITTRMRGASG